MSAHAEARTPHSAPKKPSFKEKREYETLEVRIPQLETEKAEIEKVLYGGTNGGLVDVRKLSDR